MQQTRENANFPMRPSLAERCLARWRANLWQRSTLRSANGWPRIRRASPQRAALGALERKIRERLDLMHEVARAKWNARRPVRDPEREAALLNDMIERGRALQLDPDFTRDFFTAQIEAAVRIQQADFQQWERDQQPPFSDAPSLAVLRERIDTLNQELLVALARARAERRSSANIAWNVGRKKRVAL
jgi:chorismate mutase-like protein